jgi:hypothetical protein
MDSRLPAVEGRLVSQALPNPAVQVELMLSFPVTHHARLRTFGGFLTCAAGGAVRIIDLVYKDSGGVVRFTVPAFVSVAGGSVARVCFTIGAAIQTGTGTKFVCLPDIIMPDDWTVQTQVANLGVADLWSQGVVSYDLWAR